jgi:hypothetical protein
MSDEKKSADWGPEGFTVGPMVTLPNPDGSPTSDRTDAVFIVTSIDNGTLTLTGKPSKTPRK